MTPWYVLDKAEFGAQHCANWEPNEISYLIYHLAMLSLQTNAIAQALVRCR